MKLCGVCGQQFLESAQVISLQAFDGQIRHICFPCAKNRTKEFDWGG